VSDLVRFGIAIPEELLIRFDNLVARRGLAKNRSEVIRDLIREALIEEQLDNPEAVLVGTLTLVVDHQSAGLQQKIEQVKHAAHTLILSSMHIHLDAANCLEIIALRGCSADIKSFAESLLGIKGVKHGQLNATSPKVV